MVNKPGLHTYYKAVMDKKSGGICTYEVGDALNNSFSNIKINEFISVSFVDYFSPSGLTIDYNIEKTPVTFNFTIRGKSCVEISEKNRKQTTIYTSPGTSTVRIKQTRDNKGLFKIQPSVTYTSIAVHIDEQYLKELIRDEADKMPGDFIEILYNNIEYPPDERFTSGVNPEMLSVLSSLYQCPKTGNMNRFYLASKANELICLKLFQLMEQNRPGALKMTKQDRQNVISAREFLLKDLAAPPSINELSRMAGINRLKLQQGFRQEFGTTVYDYLNHCRMERSMELLSKKQNTVSETAAIVGYSNISKFINAFKKRYGITPGKLITGN